MWLKNYYHIAAGGKWPKGTTGGSEWRERDGTKDIGNVVLKVTNVLSIYILVLSN